MLAIKRICLELKSVNAIHAAKIDTQMPRHSGSFMKRIDTALLAEIMPGSLRTELVKAQHPVLGINFDFIRGNDIC